MAVIPADWEEQTFVAGGGLLLIDATYFLVTEVGDFILLATADWVEADEGDDTWTEDSGVVVSDWEEDS